MRSPKIEEESRKFNKAVLEDNELNTEVKNIILALHNSKNGDNVYVALTAVPTENLNDMEYMIKDILLNRRNEEQSS